MQLQLSLTREETLAAAALAALQSGQLEPNLGKVTPNVPPPPPPVKLPSHPPNPALVASVKANTKRRKMRLEQTNRLRTALKIEVSTPKDNCHKVKNIIFANKYIDCAKIPNLIHLFIMIAS